MQRTALAALAVLAMTLIFAAPVRAGLSVPVCPPAWAAKFVQNVPFLVMACPIDAVDRARVEGVRRTTDRTTDGMGARGRNWFPPLQDAAPDRPRNWRPPLERKLPGADIIPIRFWNGRFDDDHSQVRQEAVRSWFEARFER